jgi:hypothetical protein
MASRLSEIYRSEKKAGGGLGSAVGKSLKEKIDPRKMFDQNGLLVSMFSSLKAYNATAKNKTSQKTSGSSGGGGIDNSILSSIAATSSLTAKNTMALPMMARDMNLMKSNIFKLVKLQGGSANTNKTDVFWKNAKERNSIYENTIGKFVGAGKSGRGASNKQNRDGQSADKALFVTGGNGGNGESETSLLGGALESLGKSATVARMATLASSVLSSPLFLASAGVLGTLALAKKLTDKEIQSNPDKYSKIPSVRAENEGITKGKAGQLNKQEALKSQESVTNGLANLIVEELIAQKLSGDAADSYIQQFAPVHLEYILELCDASLKDDYMKMVADKSKPTSAPIPPPAPPAPVPPAPPAPVPPAPPLGAFRTPNGNPGFSGLVTSEVPPAKSPTPVSAAETIPDMSAYKSRAGVGRDGNIPTPTPTAPSVPSNVVTSGSGEPVRTGSGGYLTSGSPSPVPTTKPPSSSPTADMSAYRSRAGVGRESSSSTSPTPTGKNSLLDMIAKGESASSGGYNAMNQGTIDPKTGKSSKNGKVIGSGDSQNIIQKKLTDMTVGEIMALDATKENDGKKRKEKGLIFAAGRYQIIPSTLEGLVNQGIVSKGDKFDEATQDKLGMALIKETGALDLAAAGKFDEAQNAMAAVWASVPLATDVGGRKAGESVFGGPGNKAHASLNVKGALMASLPSTGVTLASASMPSSGSSLTQAQASVLEQQYRLMGNKAPVINAPVTNTIASSSRGGGNNNMNPYDSDLMKYLLKPVT